jgi:aryl-alcohol dehydrogenase-like predicted oxidoreductase
MEQRRLGKTGYMSSILTFGGAALWLVSQAEADAGIALAIEHGINQIDVAPEYGQAEMRLAPWLAKHRRSVFLAGKTRKRTNTEVRESIRQSLKTLKADDFDLFQFHGVDDEKTLNTLLGPDGGLEAVLEAKKQGQLRYIGITGHKPAFLAEALKHFDFDTVLFPMNRVLAAHPDETIEFNTLIKAAKQKDVGTLSMKAVTRSPWTNQMHMYKTWYEPFDTQDDIDKSIWYALSQDVTSLAMPGDLRLWPMVIDAAEKFKPMPKKEQSKVITEAKQYRPLFPPE